MHLLTPHPPSHKTRPGFRSFFLSQPHPSHWTLENHVGWWYGFLNSKEKEDARGTWVAIKTIRGHKEGYSNLVCQRENWMSFALMQWFPSEQISWWSHPPSLCIWTLQVDACLCKDSRFVVSPSFTSYFKLNSKILKQEETSRWGTSWNSQDKGGCLAILITLRENPFLLYTPYWRFSQDIISVPVSYFLKIKVFPGPCGTLKPLFSPELELSCMFLWKSNFTCYRIPVRRRQI